MSTASCTARESGTCATAARTAIAGCIAFFALLASLHALRRDLDPSWHFISEYEVGRWGWVMRLAFFALGFACFSLLVALLAHARGIVGRLGLLLLGVSGLGMALAGVFAPSDTNVLHEVGAMLDQFPFAALFITLGLWWKPAWRPARRTLLNSLLALWFGLAIFVISMAIMQPARDKPPGPDVLVGWPNRIFIAAHCVWLAAVAWAALRTSTGTVAAASTTSAAGLAAE